ncbi:MAG TPA: ATPase, T2SS/T4P/T4SS family [Tepidisphaeraceae bacterium]|nr:ATPase, T2SS/T4P/T4SS family [Tepidisphaeraceae bacterium]
MSRVTPPPAGAGQPNQPQRPTPQASASIPGIAANKPNSTTPKAPSVGASAPPTASGRPANMVPPRPGGATAPAGAPRPGMPGAKPGGPGAPGGAKPGMPASAPAGGAMPPIDQLQGRPIGRVLTKMGKVTRDQVVEALTFQKSKGGALGRILIDLGYIKENDLNTALAAQRGYEFVNLEGVTIPPEAIAAVPAQIATTNKVLPVGFDKASKKLTVVMANHENFRALDDLRSLMGYAVTAKVGDPEQIERLIGKHYQAAAESIGEILGELSNDESLKDLKNRGESIDLDSLKDAADSNPVRKLINLVLLQAIKDKASDIHFEPFEDEFKMRYRIDGVLYEMMPPPNHIAPAISSRVKVMANLDIAERRMPQDGRIELSVNNQPIDLRVSVLPTMFGESVVMRVLDRSNVALDLDKIGLREEDLTVVRQLIHKPNGVVIVTGPTGSGKTTTLYSALRELNDISSKLITAEDPVEYDIDGIIQCQIKPEIELTFGRILRSMLRQDPDVVLVGEIRDHETAKIAIEAALTGHLVFSTLHTNDAPSSIARLLDLGLEPFLVTAAIEGVVAQRLVRKICANCKTEYQPTEEQLMELELRPDDVAGQRFFYGKGCESCNNTGYRGRMGLYEIMTFDDELRDMIIKHASTQVLRAESRKRGMRTLRQSGLLAIYDGITTIEEVVRETIMEDD